MCNKKERKRNRRWYLFPVSTLGAVYFAVHGGTGRFVLFFEAGRGGFYFFRGGTGRGVISEAGRGGFFFFFDGTGRGGVFFLFEGRDGTVVFGGGNCFGGTVQNRPCKALDFSLFDWVETHTKPAHSVLRPSASRELGPRGQLE